MENKEELTDLIGDFAGAFDNLQTALEDMKYFNDRILEIDVENNAWLKTQQDKIYNFNEDLIKRIKEAIFGE